jgi:uncharacterized protein (DUF4415 family)
MTDAEIRRTSPPELADLPADFWDDHAVVVPVAKQAISLRVDGDVLAWFKATGPRYQSRMNAVLRSYMAAAQQPAASVEKKTKTVPKAATLMDLLKKSADSVAAGEGDRPAASMPWVGGARKRSR